MTRIVVCGECGKKKEHHARGLCESCYRKWLLKNNPSYHKKELELMKKWRLKNKQKRK